MALVFGWSQILLLCFDACAYCLTRLFVLCAYGVAGFIMARLILDVLFGLDDQHSYPGGSNAVNWTRSWSILFAFDVVEKRGGLEHTRHCLSVVGTSVSRRLVMFLVV